MTTLGAGSLAEVSPWCFLLTPKSSPVQTVTNADGHFATGGTAKPGHYDVTLSVSCASAAKLVKVFRHDRQVAHQVTVILGLVQRGGKAPQESEMLTRSAMAWRGSRS